MNEPIIREEVPNPTVDRQILHQLSMSNGRYSKRVLTNGDISPAGEVYGWLVVLEETKFMAITDLTISPADEANSALVPIVFPAGMSIAGRFTDIEVDAGTVIVFANVYIDE